MNRKKDCFYGEFKEAFIKTLDKQAPIKKKLLRHNQSPFMTKDLRKAIMTRSRFKNTTKKELLKILKNIESKEIL